jgi:2-dehydro-3-deoxyphosphogluconate aldolase / (4S)-4-hydroxy-2-oxoglutarate aldolase
MTDVLQQLGKLRIVPVVSLERATDAWSLADALVTGGLGCMEITFRTAAAEQAIFSLKSRRDILVGAGTVLNVDTVKKALEAGAKFIVSPGFNPKVVSYCVENHIPVTPGVATPTEIEMALDHGLTAVKFFPAEALGGLKTLKAFAAPYGMMRFIPTGGIDVELLGKYLEFKPVLAVGGSWMVDKQLIAAGKFSEITDITRRSIALADKVRPPGKTL